MAEHDEDAAVQPSNLWSVHSEAEGRPYIRAWAKSEAEATQKMAELKARDPNAAKNRYFLVRLTRGQVEGLKQTGFIPKDA